MWKERASLSCQITSSAKYDQFWITYATGCFACPLSGKAPGADGDEPAKRRRACQDRLVDQTTA